MDYQEAWRFLDDLQFFKIKLGLDSMGRFLADLGEPQQGLRFVHVAGTNGKGSTSATLLAILARAGYRVGLYTSPHLSSVRERFRINDRFMGRDDFAALASRIRDILNGRQITYFEFTTALALLWFAQEKVDLAILEVGLGGRLDATNVITPEVAVITNVSMDHEAYLGNTLAEVAGEKAGIIKPGVPVVSAVAADESRTVVERVCAERRAPLYLLGRDFEAFPESPGRWRYRGIDRSERQDLPCLLRGAYQIDNAAVAVAVCELLAGRGYPVAESAVQQGLSMVRWPGRMEGFTLRYEHDRPVPCEGAGPPGDATVRRYLLDGAHNPAGVESLRQALADDCRYRRLIMVWASMADKNVAPMLASVAPLCDHLIFTRPEAERSALPERLGAMVPEGLAEVECIESVAAALARARELAAPDDLICVAGSLYLVGAARAQLCGGLVA